MKDVFPQALLDALAADPETPAFEHGPRAVARGELLELIARFTDGLRTAGLGRGQGLAIATAVTPEGFALRIAANVLGCRVVGVRQGLTVTELPYVVGDVAALAVDDSAAAPELLAAAPKVLRLPDLVGDTKKPVASAIAEDAALVTYTSGSTGVPKGVTFSYSAMTANWAWQRTNWSPEVSRLSACYRRFLLFGTLSSAVMLEHLGFCLLSGGTAVIPVEPPVFPRVLAELRITALLLTVPRLHRMLDVLREQDVDLSPLRSLIVAGSPVEPHRLAQAHKLIGDAVHQGYGQTETGMLSLLTPSDIRERPETLASVGRPWAGVCVELRDPTGNPVPVGTTGEVWVRADHTFVGYRHNAEETAEVLRDGWVNTRDLGHLDDHGFLYLTGRSRDVIMVNAVIHYAGPIERALASHADVDQAYVVGAPDEWTGEAMHAFVVAVEGRSLELDALRALVAEQLGEAAVPSTITVVDAVPVAPSGKPDKRALLATLKSRG